MLEKNWPMPSFTACRPFMAGLLPTTTSTSGVKLATNASSCNFLTQGSDLMYYAQTTSTAPAGVASAAVGNSNLLVSDGLSKWYRFI